MFGPLLCLIVSVCVWYTLFVCVVLAIVCDICVCSSLLVGVALLFFRFDLILFGLQFVVCVICFFVTMCLCVESCVAVYLFSCV